MGRSGLKREELPRRNMPEGDPDKNSPSEEVVEEAIVEAHRVLDNSRESMHQQSSFSMEMVKINLLVLGLLPAILNITNIELNLRISVVGVVLFISIVCAFIAITKAETIHGLNSQGLRTLKQDSKRRGREALLVAYQAWIDDMSEINENVALYCYISMGLTTSSVVLLGFILITS